VKKIILLSSIIFISFGNVRAQGITFSMNTGYGFYNMSSLKDFTQNYFETVPFNAKIISNYPPYLYYKPMLLYTIKHLNVGFSYTFQSSGSRISSKDYSGEYLFDTRIKANSMGFAASYTIKDYKSLQFGVQMGAGLTNSYLQIDESLKLDTAQVSYQYKAKNNSVYIEPGLYSRYQHGAWGLELNVSYCAETKRTDFELIDFPDQKIEVKKGLGHPDIWNGFRLGITASFSLMKKAKSESQ
jgi:hypothetical protein